MRALIVLFSLGMPFAFHSACGNEGVCFAFSLASGICEWVQCIRDLTNLWLKPRKPCSRSRPAKDVWIVWQPLSNNGIRRKSFRLTEIVKDGHRSPKNDGDCPSSPKIAKDFDGKMCDVGQHHRLRPSGLRLSYSPSARQERWRGPGRRRLRLCRRCRFTKQGVRQLRAFCRLAPSSVPSGFLSRPEGQRRARTLC